MMAKIPTAERDRVEEMERNVIGAEMGRNGPLVRRGSWEVRPFSGKLS